MSPPIGRAPRAERAGNHTADAEATVEGQKTQPKKEVWAPGAARTRGPRLARAAAPDAKEAARAFAAARTPQAFRAWADASPAGAALWLKKVAQAGNQPASVTALDAVLQSPKGKAAEVSRVFDTLQGVTLQPAEANERQLDPPSLTGKVTMKNAVPVLSTAMGEFTIGNVANLNRSTMLGGIDAQAFAGRTVTVRGWPDDAWTPGTQGTLAVEEFSPGTSPDFISGRVVLEGDDVFVQARPDRKVQVTDPELAGALRSFPTLGVVLPGATEGAGDQRTYAGKPENYYILAGFDNARGAQPVGDTVNFDLQLAHGMTVPCQMPTEAWNGTARQQRHYVYGRFAEGKFIAQGLSASAGIGGLGIGPEKPPKSRPSMAFIQRAIPVVPEIYSNVDARFAPR